MEKKLTAHEEKLSETKQKISANSQSVLLIGNTNDTIILDETSLHQDF